MLRNILTSFLLFFFCASLMGQDKYQSPRPFWVSEQAFPTENSDWQVSGYQWLLYDRQVNFGSAENYFHYAFKLESPEAVNTLSNIEISYDPSFQTLSFHEILVHRAGEVISVLDLQIPKEIRKESSRDRLLYDSTLSVIFNLNDIRPGDILEYSFTRKGNNPLFKDHYFASEYFDKQMPVGLSIFRVLAPLNNTPEYFLANDAPEPKIGTWKNNREMLWRIAESKQFDFYQNEPSWYDGRRNVVLSNYNSWEELNKKLLPWYKIPKKEEDYLGQMARELTAEDETISEKITRLSRFVQDEVRYLGFENGINAFKPHSSLGVYKNRYGDCKDKSLLLVGLLKGIGVGAAPMLVNTNLRHSLKEEEVSPYLFNHCVVVLGYKGDSAYVDPTISNMGNSFLELSFPTYGKGLILAEGSTNLHRINQLNEGKIEITERFIVNAPGSSQPTKLEVNSSFEGIEADNIRSYFLGNSIDVITKNYEDYYAYTYPHIESTGLLEIEDDREANIIRVKEAYEIDSLWNLDESTWRANFVNSQLQGMLSYAEDNNRTAPLYLAFPQRFIYNRILILPSAWGLNPNTDLIEAPEYRFSYNEKAFDNNRKVVIRQVYETQTNEVEAENYSRFVRDHDKMLGQLSYQLSKPKESSLGSLSFGNQESGETVSSFSSWIYILVMLILAIIFWLSLSRKLSKYDPAPPSWVKSENNMIGGWLLFFTFTHALFVLASLYSFFSFDSVKFQDLFSSETEGFVAFSLFLEKIYQLALFIWSMQVFIYLIKRRSSAIKLVKIHLIILSIAIITLLILDQFSMNSNSDGSLYRDIFQLIIIFAWYYYFSNSQRVSETLVIRKDGGVIYTQEEQAEMAAREETVLQEES